MPDARRAARGAAACICALLVAAALVVAAAGPSAGGHNGAKVAVIVNRANPVAALADTDVKTIYSGQATAWADGLTVTPYDLTAKDAAREVFSAAVFNMPPQRVEEELAALKLANRAANPPTRLKDQAAVIERVSEERGAIGYVFYRNAVNNPHVKIILLIEGAE